MNSRNTWFWLVVAAGLFAFIFFFERHVKQPEVGPQKILPGLRTNEINSVQVFPKGQRPIRVVRTNDTWRLTEPVDYPAQSIRVEALLAVLEGLRAHSISSADVKNLPDADQQFGFDPPQVSLMIGHSHVLVGSKTAPGDQVFVQVVGSDDIYVVDADLLKLIPRTADEWRDTQLVDWNRVEFDRLIVTNGGKILELRHDSTNGLWRMSVPMDTRADSGRIGAALARLPALQALAFDSDAPDADLERYGLQTPEFSLAFVKATNTVLLLEFGKSPTNNPDAVFARRAGQDTIVTVSKRPVEPWLASRSDNFRDFLDRHLLVLESMPDHVQVQAQDDFTLVRGTNDEWRVMPQGYPADAVLVAGFARALTNLEAGEIVADNITEADLPKYGLATPVRRYSLLTGSDPATCITNCVLEFGTQEGRLFARRAGEGFVYAIDATNLDWLPRQSLEMRDRRIWSFASSNVVRIAIHQRGKTRELVRRGTDSWALAPGSQGIMDDVFAAAIEETVHRLGELQAAGWVDCGDQAADAFGFKDTDYDLTLELNTGEKRSVMFGSDAPDLFPYASVLLDGRPWVFEFPWPVYQYVQMYLTIPDYVP